MKQKKIKKLKLKKETLTNFKEKELDQVKGGGSVGCIFSKIVCPT